MNFAGMVFELMLSGFWWAVALTAACIATAAALGSTEPITTCTCAVATIVREAGLTGAVVVFTVTYALGQAGRRVARMVYREYRQWVDTKALLMANCDRRRLIKKKLMRLTGMTWARLFLDASEAVSAVEARIGIQQEPKTKWASWVIPLLWGSETHRQVGSALPALLGFPPMSLPLNRGDKGELRSLREARHALDLLRDYVLAQSRDKADFDLMYHWRCLDAAQNATIPLTVTTLSLSVTLWMLLVPDAAWWQPLLLITASCLACYSVTLSIAHNLRDDRTHWHGLTIPCASLAAMSFVAWLLPVFASEGLPALGAALVGFTAVRLLNESFERHSHYRTCAIVRGALILQSLGED